MTFSNLELRKFAMNIIQKKSEKNPIREEKNLKLSFQLNNVYVISDYIFLDITFENKTNLAYNIDNIQFSIEDKKIYKATNNQSIPIEPIVKLFDGKQFKKTYHNIYVFKKFTFPNSKILKMRLLEEQISGRESNYTTWRLAKMNLAVRGIDSDIRWNNEGSFHKDELRDLKADYILANPPFNISDWGGDRLREDVRWKFGAPPVGNANYAWLQHIYHHLAPNGTAGVVLANGSMSSMTWKSGNESTVRGYKFTYDGLDRMLNATYGETASISTNANRFSENVTGYDKNGNIKSLQRYGQTGADMPNAVSTFLDTPRNGQIPRNCDNTMLLTKIAEININIYSIISILIMNYKLCFLEAVNQRNEVSQSNKRTRCKNKYQHTVFFGKNREVEYLACAQEFADSTQ
jgi:hypothetical protein